MPDSFMNFSQWKTLEAALYLSGCAFAMGNLQEAREKLNQELKAMKSEDSKDENALTFVNEAQMEYNLAVMRAKKGFDYQVAHKHILTSLRKMEATLQIEEEQRRRNSILRDENYEVFAQVFFPYKNILGFH